MFGYLAIAYKDYNYHDHCHALAQMYNFSAGDTSAFVFLSGNIV